MADIADLAARIEQEHLDRGIAQARAFVMPAGEPGECDRCGDFSARLVGGHCAPCREPEPRTRRVAGDRAVA